jgi:polyhydroxyalkanoate synthesis regulator phasin
MALTESENARILAIEEMLNNVQVALNQLATKTQLKSLANIRQAEIDTLKEQVAALEQRIFNLESS